MEPAPLEERWEALESLERITRDTRTRYSTGEISLVRHPDGLDLVRIGRPQLPEYAAWRYGTELVRRRRRHILVGGAVTVGGGHPSAKQVTAVDVPEMSFLMIDGQGDPNTSPDYGHAISLPAREAPTIELHHFIDESGRERCGKHHEIYLSDLRRADPSKWKTVGRQPMR